MEANIGVADPGMSIASRETGRKDDAIPLFEPRPGGPAERFSDAVGDRHPVVAFFLALISGYVLLAAVSIALGLLVTNVLLSVDGVERQRPDVERLESLPVDDSYPSGHTAASVALYSGLALLLTSRFALGRWRLLVWVIVLAIPPIVALSRIYRGMHHPIDALGGVPIGIAAIIVVVFACRVAGAAMARRESAEAR